MLGAKQKESDAVTICNLVLNTAEGHFNDHKMASLPIGQSVVFGGVTISMIIGLASQDTGATQLESWAWTKLNYICKTRGHTLRLLKY